MSKLLIQDYPLMVSPRLAVAIGLNEAIVLQQLHYWLGTAGKERAGRLWVYNTLGEWNEQFPFWGLNTVRRTIGNLEETGLVESTDEFNVIKSDRTKWYTIGYGALDALDMGLLESTGHMPKMGRPSAQNGQVLASAQNGQVIPEKRLHTETTLNTGAENHSAGVEASLSQESVSELITPAASSETEVKVLDTVPRRRAPAAELPEVPADLALLPGLLDAWSAWLTYRKERRLPTAPSTAKGMFVKLREFQQAGHDPAGVIHNSIAQGWQGLFPPRAEHVVKFQPKTTEEANSRAAQRASDIYEMLQEETHAVF